MQAMHFEDTDITKNETKKRKGQFRNNSVENIPYVILFTHACMLLTHMES